MRVGLQYVLWAIGLSLQVLAIQSLVRGPYRKYPFLFIYSVTLFLTTVIEVSTFTAAAQGARSVAKSIRLYYWINDAVLQALVFCVVISLIYRALASTRVAGGMKRWLVAGAFLIFGLSFLLHGGPRARLSEWMTLISRDLSFVAVILDLLLWSLLIAAKKKDHQLLMLSGALGIQFTGTAIGQSVRQLALSMLGRNRTVALIGSVLVVVSNLICLYVWWQTFRREPANPPRPLLEQAGE